MFFERCGVGRVGGGGCRGGRPLPSSSQCEFFDLRDIGSDAEDLSLFFYWFSIKTVRIRGNPISRGFWPFETLPA